MSWSVWGACVSNLSRYGWPTKVASSQGLILPCVGGLDSDCSRERSACCSLDLEAKGCSPLLGKDVEEDPDGGG